MGRSRRRGAWTVLVVVGFVVALALCSLISCSAAAEAGGNRGGVNEAGDRPVPAPPAAVADDLGDASAGAGAGARGDTAAVTENVLCALLHLQVPAQYWASENSFLALKKILAPLTNAQRVLAEQQVRELVRAQQLAGLEMRQRGAITTDEFEAVTRHEIVLNLRRRELDKLMRRFEGLREPPRYLTAHSELLKTEIAAVAASITATRRAVAERPPRGRPTIEGEGEAQEMLESDAAVAAAAAAAGSDGGGAGRRRSSKDDPANAVIAPHEHRLHNVVEMDSDALYQQKARELRRRIERSTKPAEKKALRGELATLYQQHSTTTRRTSGSAPRKGVYRTLEGETPAQVAALLGVDVNKLLVENYGHRPDLLPSTRMEQGSPLVIPKVLLHHAQQRLREATAVGQARQAAQRARNLHLELLRAVEAQDYDRATVLAAKLKEAEEDSDSVGGVDVSSTAGGKSTGGSGNRGSGGGGGRTGDGGGGHTTDGGSAGSSGAPVKGARAAGSKTPKHTTAPPPVDTVRTTLGRAGGGETLAKRAKDAAKADAGSGGGAKSGGGGRRREATRGRDAAVGAAGAAGAAHKPAGKQGPAKGKKVADGSFVAAKAMTLLVSCAACGPAPIRVENVHQDLTIARVMELAERKGLPEGYDSFLYKGKHVPPHHTVKDLRVPAKHARGVRVSVMRGARRDKGPDPLGHRAQNA